MRPTGAAYNRYIVGLLPNHVFLSLAHKISATETMYSFSDELLWGDSIGVGAGGETQCNRTGRVAHSLGLGLVEGITHTRSELLTSSQRIAEPNVDPNHLLVTQSRLVTGGLVLRSLAS